MLKVKRILSRTIEVDFICHVCSQNKILERLKFVICMCSRRYKYFSNQNKCDEHIGAYRFIDVFGRQRSEWINYNHVNAHNVYRPSPPIVLVFPSLLPHTYNCRIVSKHAKNFLCDDTKETAGNNKGVENLQLSTFFTLLKSLITGKKGCHRVNTLTLHYWRVFSCTVTFGGQLKHSSIRRKTRMTRCGWLFSANVSFTCTRSVWWTHLNSAEFCYKWDV